jgi:DNA-binding SARP family transcriptional activator
MTAMPQTRFRLLGAPQLVDAQGAHALPETAPAYLALFLAAQGGWVARDTAACLLWPELPQARAQHNLRVALNRTASLLKRWQLGPALVAERRRLRLDVASDLADFRAALAAENWAHAAALPGGPLLAGARFAPYPALAEWLDSEREALRWRWQQALARAAASGVLDDAALARYRACHADDTDMARLQVNRLVAAGRATEARAALAAWGQAAADVLPAAELQATWQGIEQAAGLASVADAVGSPPGLALWGRDDAMAALQRAAGQHRWVTVTGLAGTGKSALLAAWRQAHGGADASIRMVQIGLNERSSALALVHRLVQGLTGEPAGRIGMEAALALLADCTGLVVLDGMDQAGPGSDVPAMLGRLASACPRLRLLCASRQPLGQRGEFVLPLAGLATRAAGAGLPPDAGTSAALSDAAQFFLQEALRARPGVRFEATPGELEQIAHASGGLPLALKLAATWSRWLGPADIAGELERSVRGGPGALDDALHGLLAACWRGLAPSQQHALEALAVYPGAFDMATAVALADQPTPQIERLIAASLLETEPGAPTLLRLHALVRAFAQQRLAAAPARARQVAARYLACVDRALGPRPIVDGQPVFALAQAAAHVDALLAAWQQAIDTGAIADMGWLMAALLEWHERMGEYRGGLALLDQGRAVLDESQPAEAAMLARLMAARATLLYRCGDHDAAEHAAMEARRLAEATGQRRVLQRALNIAGLSRWLMLRLAEAREAFEAGLALAVAAEDLRFESVFVCNLALIDKSRGDFRCAEARWRRALQIDRSLGDWVGAVTLLNNLANLLRHEGRLAECEPLATEALRLCREHGLDGKRPFALIGLALLNWQAGQAGRAADYLALLDGCKAASVESTVLAGAANLRADMALARGDPDKALDHIAAALQTAAQAGDEGNRGEALMVYGRWLWHGRRCDEAARLWRSLRDAPHLHATLREDARRQLAQARLDTHDAQPGNVDLTLLAEQVLQAAAAATPQALA